MQNIPRLFKKTIDTSLFQFVMLTLYTGCTTILCQYLCFIFIGWQTKKKLFIGTSKKSLPNKINFQNLSSDDSQCHLTSFHFTTRQNTPCDTFLGKRLANVFSVFILHNTFEGLLFVATLTTKIIDPGTTSNDTVYYIQICANNHNYSFYLVIHLCVVFLIYWKFIGQCSIENMLTTQNKYSKPSLILHNICNMIQNTNI